MVEEEQKPPAEWTQLRKQGQALAASSNALAVN